MKGWRRNVPRVKTIAVFVLALLVLVPLLTIGSASLIDSARASRARQFNAPDILIQDVAVIEYPDAEHISLNGTQYRLAHVVAPDRESPLYSEAVAVLQRPLSWGGNVMRGLRSVGKNSSGETLVELWALQPSLGGCGNMTWSERRDSRIPRWQNLTWQLLSPGLYRLDNNATNPEWIKWQDAARREGQGVWGDAGSLTKIVDVAALERTLTATRSDGHPGNRERRLEAAQVLMRVDSQLYTPKLLAIIQNPQENDVFIRIRLAQLLDKSGVKDGTRYLMGAIKAGGRGASLDQYQLNSVVLEYQSFWNVHSFSHGDHPAMLEFYRTKIEPLQSGD